MNSTFIIALDIVLFFLKKNSINVFLSFHRNIICYGTHWNHMLWYSLSLRHSSGVPSTCLFIYLFIFFWKSKKNNFIDTLGGNLHKILTLYSEKKKKKKKKIKILFTEIWNFYPCMLSINWKKKKWTIVTNTVCVICFGTSLCKANKHFSYFLSEIMLWNPIRIISPRL